MGDEINHIVIDTISTVLIDIALNGTKIIVSSDVDFAVAVLTPKHKYLNLTEHTLKYLSIPQNEKDYNKHINNNQLSEIINAILKYDFKIKNMNCINIYPNPKFYNCLCYNDTIETIKIDREYLDEYEIKLLTNALLYNSSVKKLSFKYQEDLEQYLEREKEKAKFGLFFRSLGNLLIYNKTITNLSIIIKSPITSKSQLSYFFLSLIQSNVNWFYLFVDLYTDKEVIAEDPFYGLSWNEFSNYLFIGDKRNCVNDIEIIYKKGLTIERHDIIKKMVSNEINRLTEEEKKPYYNMYNNTTDKKQRKEIDKKMRGILGDIFRKNYNNLYIKYCNEVYEIIITDKQMQKLRCLLLKCY